MTAAVAELLAPEVAAEAASLAPTPEVPPQVPMRRFTVAEYLRLHAIGVLTEDDRCELLEGWIIPKMSKNPPHEVALVLSRDALLPRIPAGWHLREQASVQTADSVPEPDHAIVRGTARDYLSGHPGPAHSSLYIEIADSSLATDRRYKARIYARASIPVCWIINLVDRQVEVYTDPTGPGESPSYRSRTDYVEGQSVPLVLDGSEVGLVAVADVLP